MYRNYVFRRTPLIYVGDEEVGGSLSLGVMWRIPHLARLDCIEALDWGCGLAIIGEIETSLGAISQAAYVDAMAFCHQILIAM